MAGVLCVLYDDPADGHPSSYARDSIPDIQMYSDGRTLPSPSGIDFRAGELLGDVSGRLGLQGFLAGRGHTLTVSPTDGPDSAFDRELPNAEIIISQSCWPARLPATR